MKWPHLPRVPRGDAPPTWSEPLFALIEEVDRRRLRIRPIRPGGITGVSWRRHRGSDVALRDGTVIRDGDLIADLHLDNRAMAGLTSDGWQTTVLEHGRNDARTLARWARRQPPQDRPVAYHGMTLLWPMMRRLGAEIHERPRTSRVAWEDWYLRGVLRRWAKGGAQRLAVGHGELRSRDWWISAAELERRYGREPSRPKGDESERTD